MTDGDTSAAPSAAPEAGYLFEGQLSQVICQHYLTLWCT